MNRKTLFLTAGLLVWTAAMLADEWTLVSDASTLKAGDRIVMGYAAANITAAGELTTNSSKNSYWMNPVTSTFSGTSLTAAGSGTGIFTLGGKNGEWTFANASGQLLGATAAKKLAYDGNNATNTWTITISNGEATVASTNAAFGTLYYNSASNSNRFCNYTTTQNMKKLQLYRLGSSTPAAKTYSLSYQGFPYKKTLCEEPAYEAGTVITLSAATPVQGGKQLTGWRYDGKIYEPGASFTMPEEDVELAPVWDYGTGMESILPSAVRVRKVLRDGQLYLLYNGTTYNVQGQRVE